MRISTQKPSGQSEKLVPSHVWRFVVVVSLSRWQGLNRLQRSLTRRQGGCQGDQDSRRNGALQPRWCSTQLLIYQTFLEEQEQTIQVQCRYGRSKYCSVCRFIMYYVETVDTTSTSNIICFTQDSLNQTQQAVATTNHHQGKGDGVQEHKHLEKSGIYKEQRTCVSRRLDFWGKMNENTCI